ncbi:MAG: hypothetical protein ABIR96_07230 [Bdellovibrionota bacterium]
MKRVSSPWGELFGRKEERALLSSIKAKKWQPEASYSLLKELLNPLVQSLHFNSHSRWGLQTDSQEIRTLALKFLHWMLKNNEWGSVEARVGAKTRASSLQVCLSRCFVRFRSESGLKAASEREPSYSARRSLMELPDPQTLAQIGGAVLDAFASLTAQLPEALRLPYQLHLEGLVDDEIAALLDVEIHVLSERIRDAKSYIKEPAPWKRAS